MSSYENFGDVNPIDHGGFWITKDESREHAYYVVANVPSDDQENTHQFYDMYMELDDSWIEWDSVNSSCGETANEFQKCQNLFWHYGGHEFMGCESPRTIDTDELCRILDAKGITYKHTL